MTLREDVPVKLVIRSIVIVFGLSLPIFAQSSGSIAPAENLVVEGVPAIPASLAETVDRYTNYRGAGIMNWHPTRREMLITTRFADTPQIHRVLSPGAARRQLTFYPDAVFSALYQPTQGKFFIFSKDVGGGEFFQLYRYDLDTNDVMLLTDGKSRNTGAVWSYAGDRLAYGSTRRNGNDVDVYVMNPSEPKSDRMLSQMQGGGWSVLDWSPDGKQILVQEEISANESYLWLVDSSGGQKTLITPKSGSVKIAYSGGMFSKDNKGIYVTTDKDSEFQRLAYVDLATKQHTFLTTQIPWDVDEFDLSEDGKHIAFVVNEDGYGVLHLMETATRKEHVIQGIPKGIVSDVRWHKNSRDLGFNLSSARATSDSYSLDVVSGAISRWTTGGGCVRRIVSSVRNA